MDIFEAINTRHTTRNYKSDKPSKEEIERIINSARLAPSAMNTQNWKFIAILNDDVKQALADAVFAKYDEFEKILKPETYSKLARFKAHSVFFKDAPMVIACVETYAPRFLEGILEEAGLPQEEILDLRPDSFLLSMGGAIENITLSAHALGYGTCWMVAPLIAQKGMRKVLNLNNDEQIVSLLAIGKPNDVVYSPKKKELNDVMKIIE